MSAPQNYNPKEIEAKWQKEWDEKGLYKTPENVSKENKMYILPQLPYPSGSGLHVGHAEVYTACDIYARYQRMCDMKVLQVIGWDAFGLPAENYAIKTNVHPRKSTNDAIDNFRSQIKALGVSVDWDREVGSHNPDYYTWTQWFFLLMYKRGLAYRKNQSVNWCDSCKTVLANEQVSDGKCERCDTPVSQRQMEQWYLKITEYADKLLEGLDRIDWPEETKKRQRDWIGRSEGAEIDFEIEGADKKIRVFTTRPDTIFGATYIVWAPEHELVEELKANIKNWEEVSGYVKATKFKTEFDRQIETEKTGVELQGLKAVNPANGASIPIWIADYVLASYGTGSIMAVPAHDERDFEFAKKFGLEIKVVVEADEARYLVIEKSLPKEALEKLHTFGSVSVEREDAGWGKFFRIVIDKKLEVEFVDFLKENLLNESVDGGFWYADSVGSTNKAIFRGVVFDVSTREDFESFKEYGRSVHVPEDQLELEFKCFSALGVSVNSEFLDGLATQEAKQEVIKWLEDQTVGVRKVQYKLRDWSVSRQRFWGAPIPMLFNENFETGEREYMPVSEIDLPVILPDDVDFKPTGQSPLTYSEAFQKDVEEKYGASWKREPDTLDTFMCSSWYYFRYLDPHNNSEFASSEQLKKWMPVDFYLGGAEHVNGHLLYARFFTKVLYDAGYIDFDEPFLKHRHQGIILAEDNRKMSKRWNNVINPTDVISEFGADTCRMYEMFMGPLEDTKPWSTNGVRGVRRFLDRVWRLQDKITEDGSPDNAMEILLNKTIKKVGEDLNTLQFNTAVAKLMELSNAFGKQDSISKKDFETFVMLLAPLAPHIAEEMWQNVGHKDSVTEQQWPKYDAGKLLDDSIILVVQVNGKVRANLEVSKDISEESAKAAALADANVQKWLDGKEPKKVIFVKGKLVSVVL